MGEDGTVVEKSIMNNNNDLYFQDPTVSTGKSFISFKELSYFNNIKDSEPATIKFIKVPVGESVIDYVNDEEYISSYDEITLQDEGYTWDGGLNHEDLERRITDYEFNAVRTKYISIESLINTRLNRLNQDKKDYYNYNYNYNYNYGSPPQNQRSSYLSKLGFTERFREGFFITV